MRRRAGVRGHVGVQLHALLVVKGRDEHVGVDGRQDGPHRGIYVLVGVSGPVGVGVDKIYCFVRSLRRSCVRGVFVGLDWR